MRPLELDFYRAPTASPWRWVLLLVGLTTLAALLWTHRQITQETRAELATIKAAEARQPTKSATANPADDAALNSARQAVAKTKQPWGKLFATLEKADNKDVALLGFTPEPNKGQIKIYAEARSLAAMLAYHRRLENDGLRQVSLIEHDTAKDSKNAPVRFHIIAAWGADRGRP